MPIYEYRCGACGRVVEVWQKISDPAPDACAQCGQGPMEKIISRTSFQLKGGGWYAQGYGAGGSTESKPATGGASSPPAAPTSTESATPASGTSSPADGGAKSTGAVGT